MSASIVSRTISSLIDKKLILANDQGARILNIGTNWNVIRVGWRLCANASGLTNNFVYTWYMGMSSGKTNLPGSATTTNFIGFYLATCQWTYQAGSGVPYYTGNNNYPALCKRAGTTTTDGSSFGTFPGISGDPSRRNALIMQFTKGSPNWSISLAMPGGSPQTNAQTDISQATLVTAMEASSWANLIAALPANYTNVSGTVAFTEAAGSIDSVCNGWHGSARPLEISDVLYAKIS